MFQTKYRMITSNAPRWTAFKCEHLRSPYRNNQVYAPPENKIYIHLNAGLQLFALCSQSCDGCFRLADSLCSIERSNNFSKNTRCRRLQKVLKRSGGDVCPRWHHHKYFEFYNANHSQSLFKAPSFIQVR